MPEKPLPENRYVHGYSPRESERLADQARTLTEILHNDTHYPAGSRVLEAGCGTGAQTVILAKNSPGARITSVDISSESLKKAEENVKNQGLNNVTFRQGISSTSRSSRRASTISLSVLYWSILQTRKLRSGTSARS